MLPDNLNYVRNKVREDYPLIHCITNPISISLCANAVLAVGASPVMAEHPREVEEITKSADALLVNLGNITDVRMESMKISAKAAFNNHIPFVLDAVGVACSELRRNYALDLIQSYHPTLIKGNYSELRALYQRDYNSRGVDSDTSLSSDTMTQICVELAKRYQAFILASGKTDIITDGEQIFYIYNGIPQLSKITGTGCTLGALCATYLAVKADISAIVTACTVLGICGELAGTDKGNGTFAMYLIDHLSTLTEADFNKSVRMEAKHIEKL